MLPCLSLYCFFVFGPPGLAFGPGEAAVPRAPATSIQAFGRTSQCAAWTDGCTVCTRQQELGPVACSTPGIACTPGPIACQAEAP